MDFSHKFKALQLTFQVVMKRIVIMGLALFPLLVGCVTVRDSKSLVITPEPGASKIAVTANATARCQDFFFVMSCTLALDVKEAK